jgi:pimeloyl-ACP methyl ester carboxylesterase
MSDYSAYRAAENTEIPLLVVHDKDDPEVPVKAGIHIHQHLINGKLMLTERLGHRKILGNHDVIDNVLQFITNNK